MQLQRNNKTLSDPEFLELIQARSDSFYRVAYGYVHHEEDAKDLVQEAVCKAYISKGRLRDRDKFYPWFYRILTNTAITFLRQNRRNISLDPEILELPDPSQEKRLDEAVWLRDSMDQLDQKSRTVILLKIYEDLTFSEIAQIIRKPENTVKSLYYRGLQRLKERMEVHGH